jgi:hypothetical protein
MALTKLNSLSIPANTVVATDIADGSITAAKLADDAVTTAKIADDAVTSAKTTVTSTNPNLIINGDMAIAQRGNIYNGSLSSTATGIKVVDRWGALWTGSGSAITQSQVALTSGGAYDEGHRHAYKLAVTSTSSANDRYAQMRYVPEAKDIRNFGWQYTSGSSYITLSFWAKSSLAGTYWFTFYGPDSGTAQQYTTSYALAANTWTKVTKTIPGGSNIVLNDDTGIGFYMDWRIDKGTDDTASDATLNAWHNYVAGKTGTDYAQAWQNTANATWELTGVKLEVGQTATTFQKPDPAIELVKCQRYYYNMWSNGIAQNLYAGDYGSYSMATFHHPVEMRAVPTVTATNNGSQIATYHGQHFTQVYINANAKALLTAAGDAEL